MSAADAVLASPTVTVVIPTYQEAAAIDACLDALESQTYPHIVQILVVDGRSEDDTRERAARHRGVTVLDNPGRIQAAGLNIGLAASEGDVVVRVDGHCVLSPDYVTRCVDALERTGAVMVGGAMTPVAVGVIQGGIAGAMSSPLGAGPARFHQGGPEGPVDTVYLGAYRAKDARRVGGYAEDVGVNEDAEFAHRMSAAGAIWFDPQIRSTYEPRSTLGGVGRQFFRYGLSRAATARRHPRSVRLRQLAAPTLIFALAVPRTRRPAAVTYATVVAAATLRGPGLSPRPALVFAACLPVMHGAWAAGFLAGLAGALPPQSVEPAEPVPM